MESGEPDGRGNGVKDDSGVVFPELEERLWVPPQTRNRGSQNGRANRSNGATDLDDVDHGKMCIEL